MKRILVLVVTATVAVGGAAHAVVVGAAASEEPAAESPLAAARPCLMSISVANLDVSLRWYGDVLGFKVPVFLEAIRSKRFSPKRRVV